MNRAQRFLIENNQADIVLNSDKYPDNTSQNAEKWIYLSDLMMVFLKGETQ